VIGTAIATAGTLGASLPGSIIFAIGSASAIAIGVTNITTGLLAPGDQSSPGALQSINVAGQVASPGGLLAGAVTGGSQTAIAIGSAASSAISAASGLISIPSASGAGDLVGIGVGLVNDLADLANSIPQGPVIGPSISINVTGAITPVDLAPAPVTQELATGQSIGSSGYDQTNGDCDALCYTPQADDSDM
jgi:hypothetical protein